MDRDIRESLRDGDPLRAAILLKRAGRANEALDLLEREWSSGADDARGSAANLLLEALLAVPADERAIHAGRLERLTHAGLDGVEGLWQAWFPQVACLVGWSAPMRSLRAELYANAAGDAPLVLWGESGAGHEQAAYALHALSGRTGLFELYAPSPRRRLQPELEQATPGATLYLSYANQADRWLGWLPAVCAERDQRLVIGIVSDIREPSFELGGDPLATARLPSVRERPEDLTLLLVDMLTNLGALDAAQAIETDPRVVELLGHHDWPGNVRELANHVKQAVLGSPHERNIPEQLMQGMYGLPGEIAV